MVILVVSIIAGLAAAFLSVNFIRGVARTTAVLVAKTQIQPYTELTRDMFVEKQVAVSAVPADAIRDAALVSHKFTRTLLLPDTILRSGYLATSTGQPGSLSAVIAESGKPGSVALAIPVDNTTSAGGTIQAGDRVEIIAAVRIERTNGPATQYAKTIAHGVSVIYRTEPDGTATKGTVVVQVTPQQAEDIAFAQLAGTIYLATDSYKSDNDVSTLGVTPDSFIQRFGGR
jgi:pilus assembly protein CpaB